MTMYNAVAKNHLNAFNCSPGEVVVLPRLGNTDIMAIYLLTGLGICLSKSHTNFLP